MQQKSDAGQAAIAPGRTGEKVLAALPPALIPPLLAYAEYVARLEVDYIVFMARKAMRLYDLLVAAGCRVPTATVVSDHVLDQNLEILVGKRVALVDDTLILGSTLRKAHQRLIEAGVTQVTTVVFAVDGENWARDASPVDKHFVTLSAASMLVFCAAEVDALALAGIPYLTDFPISKRLRLGRSQFQTLFSLPGWDSFLLSSGHQEKEQVYYHTHVPTVEGATLLSELVGGLAGVADITKVRTFSFATKHGHLSRIVPIVTLQPLTEEDVAAAFEDLIGQPLLFSDTNRSRLLRFLVGTQAKLRFIQYFLSVVLGERYLSALHGALAGRSLADFDLTEAGRLFGPWLRLELTAVHKFARDLARGKTPALRLETQIAAAALPDDVVALAERDRQTFVRQGTSGRDDVEQSRNAFADLVRVFVDLHRNREIPARAAARENGGIIPAKYADRLRLGYSWRDLAQFLGWRREPRLRPNRGTRLSLMLDALIDLGIAVPILCIRHGVAFRAYRHGEDAPYAECEPALAYEVAAGFLEGNGREDIPRVTLEKLLVALMRVGWAKRYLRPFYGLNGSARVARIGFYRHGAVTTWSDDPSIFAETQETWLSRHLVNVGVLKRSPRGHYVLGEQPDAAFIESDAKAQARKLGRLFGSLARKPGSGTPPVLDERDLTLLTTCSLPIDAAGAIVAELRIASQWFDGHEYRLRRYRVDAGSDHKSALENLTRGGGYHAFNSARMKFVAYVQGAPAAIVERGAEALRDGTLPGRMVADEWLEIWNAVEQGASDDQAEEFNKIIVKLGAELLVIALGLFTLELVLASALLKQSRMSAKEYARICDKILQWLGAVGPHVNEHHRRQNVLKRLKERCEQRLPIEDLTASWSFGLNLIAQSRAFAQEVQAHAANAVRTYGRMQRRTDYTFAIWYDLIDSLGQKSNLRRDALDEYRQRVAAFKDGVNSGLHTLGRTASSRGVHISLATETLRSTDDEKSIFFAGAGSREWLRQTVQLILTVADNKNIGVRILAINADFAGEAPHRYYGDPQIVGPDFWEYGSRVKQDLKAQESPVSANARRSWLWLGGDLAEAGADFTFAVWEEAKEFTSTISIQNRPLQTPIYGGSVRLGEAI